jgi:transposase
MQQMERNRLDTADPLIADSLKTVLDTLDKELADIRKRIKDHINGNPGLKQRRDLLESIPGVGPATSAWLLTLLSPHYAFANAKQAVAQAGLAPKLRESGKWKGSTLLSKTGDPGLRKALYMPSLVALQHYPAIRAFCERLKASGKNGFGLACAAMRKLIHIAFAILKSGTSFDPKFKLA